MWMCVHVCANVCGIQNLSPPCPVATSWEQSSCSPGHSQRLDNDRSGPHSQLSGAPPPQPCCLGSGLLPGRGEQGSLFCRAQREGSERLGWGGALRGGSPAGPSAIHGVPPSPPSVLLLPQGASLWRPLGIGS